MLIDRVQRNTVSIVDDTENLIPGEIQKRVDGREVEPSVEFHARVPFATELRPGHSAKHNRLLRVAKPLALQTLQESCAYQHWNTPCVLQCEEADATLHQIEISQERLDDLDLESAWFQLLQVFKVDGKLQVVMRIETHRPFGFDGFVQHGGQSQAVLPGREGNESVFALELSPKTT